MSEEKKKWTEISFQNLQEQWLRQDGEKAKPVSNKEKYDYLTHNSRIISKISTTQNIYLPRSPPPASFFTYLQSVFASFLWLIIFFRQVLQKKLSPQQKNIISCQEIHFTIIFNGLVTKQEEHVCSSKFQFLLIMSVC